MLESNCMLGLGRKVLKLHDVQIWKGETCLTYALKRIGLQPDLCKFEDLNIFFDVEPFFLGPSCTRGVLLVWDSNQKLVDLGTLINSEGKIVNRPTLAGVHIGVYEGDGLVSDCSRLDSPNSLPQLKMRFLSELGRQPDKLLTFKNIK